MLNCSCGDDCGRVVPGRQAGYCRPGSPNSAGDGLLFARSLDDLVIAVSIGAAILFGLAMLICAGIANR